MALKELKRDLTEADVDVRSYLENSEEYFKLKIFKALMRAVTAFSHMMLIGAIGLLALFLFSLAASYAIGNAMEQPLSRVYCDRDDLCCGCLCMLFFSGINWIGPLLRKFSKYLF